MINNNPAVSILMPAFNREKYISESIKSVLASNFTDFELIIVDDCSTDNTVTISKAFERADPRVKVYINESNLGQFENRNYCISLAKGDYIKFLDSDDIIFPDSLRIMVEALRLFPDSGFAIQYEIGKPAKPYPFLINSIEAYRLHFLGGGLLFPGPSSVIFNKIVFKNFMYSDEFNSLGDTHLLLRIAAKFNIVAVPNNLIYWRVHNEQESEEQRLNASIYWERYLMNKDILLSSTSPLTACESGYILTLFKKILCRNILKHAFVNFDYNVIFQCKNKTGLNLQDFIYSLWPGNLK